MSYPLSDAFKKRTLSDVINAADDLTVAAYPYRNVATYLDSTTPMGTFCGTAKVLGITTTYLFRGEHNDPYAYILGRIEALRTGRSNMYVGGGVKGGELIRSTTTEEAFQRMLSN